MAKMQRQIWLKTAENNQAAEANEELALATMVAKQVKIANRPWLRMLGLMGKPSLPKGEGLWLQPCNSVHSCFMRFEFDAVFLNKKGEIVALIESMKPWRVSGLYPKANATLELPSGTVRQLGLQVGMLLAWQDQPSEVT